jgi:O-antigen/teichoic acid export membrane protein
VKDSFVQNSAYMFSASAWGILLQFIFAPILSRLYSPEVYGLFGIFNSWVVVIGVFVTLGYSQAFVLPEKDTEFRALLKLTTRGMLYISGAVTVVFIVGMPWINDWFNAEALGYWTMLVGPMVLLLAADKIIIDWSVRARAFKQQSLISLPVTLGTKLFNVGYGKFKSSTVEGLIITNGLLFAARIYLYFTRVLPNAREFLRLKVSPEELRAVKNDYKEYPRLVMWSNVLNTASSYLPIVILPIFLASTRPSGLFTYALLVLDLPTRLLGSAVTRVYYQRAVELHRSSVEEMADATWRLFKMLSLLVVLPLIILGISGEWLYEFVFGSEWSEAGLLASILGGYYYFRLVSAPISSVFNIVRKERALFKFQSLLFSFRLVSLLLTCWQTDDLVTIIVVYTLANALTYIVLIGWIFFLCQKYMWRSVIMSLVIFAASATIVMATRLLIDSLAH